ncbi:DUF354 domain-containing protein [Chitinimonas koreensis]|uniref:DUF354 domain-containing protein n=2 Tax=Chitinimonas koreensis TaxID=356302 RepID=UPI0009FC1308|nr:DUF354 domain-containing protein [Chitinimonas koreensis]
MKIWIDLSNSPHVIFFRPIIARLRAAGHLVELTYRDFAQTRPLVEKFGLGGNCIGGHGGKSKLLKVANLCGRTLSLIQYARKHRFDLAISHNSYFQVIAAKALGIPVITMMDFEGNPANHLSFRLASRVMVPTTFPDEALIRFGARHAVKYAGIKEDICLDDFEADPAYRRHVLDTLGVPEQQQAGALVVVRTPPSEALYHQHGNDLFPALLQKLNDTAGITVIVLPRYESQVAPLRQAYPRLILPQEPLDGLKLVHSADLVISAGGSMNREAAALGTPVCTIFAGPLPAVDRHLVEAGKLRVIDSLQAIEALAVSARKPASNGIERNQVPMQQLLALIDEVGVDA